MTITSQSNALQTITATTTAMLDELREIRALLDEDKRPVLSTEEAARYVGASTVEAFYKWAGRVKYKSVSNGRHHRALLDEFLARERRAFDRDFLRRQRKPRGRNAKKTMPETSAPPAI